MKARELLKDPQRRLIYDRTGKTDKQPGHDDLHVATLNRLMDILLGELGGLPPDVEPCRIDWMSVVRRRCEADLVSCDNEEIKIRRVMSLHERMGRRFKRKTNGENLLEKMFLSNVQLAKDSLDRLELRRQMINGILAMAADYDFETMMAEPQYGYGSVAPAPSIRTFYDPFMRRG